MTPTVRCLARSGAQISERRETFRLKGTRIGGAVVHNLGYTALDDGGGKSGGGRQRGRLAIARGPKRGYRTERAAGLFPY